MAKIATITAREILDSRGNPTIETTVVLDNGQMEIASCPSGASVGTHEALELRDCDPKRYNGLGVLKAVDNVTKIIAPKLIGLNPTDQWEIDNVIIELDGTENKANLGANSTLSVSMAVCKAAAKSESIKLYEHIKQLCSNSQKLTLPTPLFNIINGGKHGDGNIDFQEFFVIPDPAISFSQKLYMGVVIYMTLKKIIKENGFSVLIGDEGGFAPTLKSNTDALDLINQAIQKSGFTVGKDTFLGIDVAANSFYKDQKYFLKDLPEPLIAASIISYYQKIQASYSLVYLEDSVFEDDWYSWTRLTSVLSPQTLVVGDDLIVTNPSRLAMAIEKKAVTAVIIKPNQIGTVSEAITVAKKAKDAKIKTIASHRSGETTDDFIADFAVGTGCDFAKFGAPARGERVAKYNRLLAIESEILNPKS